MNFPSPTTNPTARRNELASSGAAALAYLVRDRLAVERTEIGRVFHAAAGSVTGPLESCWWQVFAKASSGLGVRSNVLDCSIEQAKRLLEDGADLVVFGGIDPYGWSVIRGGRGSKASIWSASTGEQKTLRRSAAAHTALRAYAEDGQIRCIAYDWWGTMTPAGKIPVRPLQRLRQLLRPEWSDIWLVVLFAFIVGLLGLATPIAVEALVNTVAFGRYLQPIIVLAALLFFFLAFSAAIQALQTYVVEIIQQRLFARVAADLANRLPRVSTEATEDQHLPELVNRFFDVVTLQKVAAKLLLDGVSLVLTVGIGMVVLGFYHPFLLGFDVVLLASITFMIVVLGRGAVKTAVKESKSKYYMASWLEDVARCESTFRSACGKHLSASRADRLIEDYLSARKSHFRVLFRQIVFALALYAVTSTVLLGLGGWLVVAGELTLGQLVAAELIVAVIVGAFAKLGKHMESFYDVLASVDKLGALFDLPAERQGGILGSFAEEAVAIEFKDVLYSRGSVATFQPIVGSLPAGASLAVIGPSGSGKSTLLDLIYGSRRPSGGQLLVNGRQPTDVQSDDYRSHVELVRRGAIFAGTIAENVHLQRPAISGDRVLDALESVGMTSVVSQLPDGIETALHSGGGPLTTNQINMLLLARSIASAPSLLLIDGLLDELSDEELDIAMNVLLADRRPWTLVVGTGRRAIADRLDSHVRLPASEFLIGERTGDSYDASPGTGNRS